MGIGYVVIMVVVLAKVIMAKILHEVHRLRRCIICSKMYHMH